MSGPDVPPVDAVDLGAPARRLPEAWRSRLLGSVGAARLKLLRMDARPYPEETHGHTEALLVLEGRLRLRLEGREMDVAAGGLCLVPAGVAHAVAEGSHGTMLIIDT
jgi:quercetin dioxygenase-like cupin family protein